MNILPIVELQKEKKQSLLINQDLSQYNGQENTLSFKLS